MKIIAIGGEPGCGKTRLMRRVIERLGPAGSFQFGQLLRGLVFADKNIVLGVYDGPLENFAGTDKLSMAVQPVAEEWLRQAPPDATVWFEGDRLFNLGFLSKCQEVADCTFLVLLASQESLVRRHKYRGDKQTDKWLQGRATKIANLINSPLKIRMMNHETEADTDKIVEFLFRKEEEKRTASAV